MAYLGNDLQVAYESYKIIDDISSSFNSSLTSFPLQVGGVAPVPFPINPQQCLISINGVVQEPDPTGTNGFKFSGNNIVFASAPTTGHSFFGVILAGADYVNVGVNYPSGLVSAPSITFDTDLDTGIYNPAANELGLVTNSNDVVRIDSSGRVGINTTSPGVALHVDGNIRCDGVFLMEDGTVSNPGLAFTDDLDTGLFRPGANQLAIATNGVERIEFGTSEVVVNDGGADVDFRVEGDTEANLLVVDAGNDRIGIAEPAPGTLVEIGSETPYVTLKNSTEEDTDGGRESRLIFEGEQSGGEISSLAQIEASHDGTADDEKGKLIISTNDGSDGAAPTTAVTIDSDQNVTIAGRLTASGINYPSDGALSGTRNRIINGDMRIAQRGTSFAAITNGTYSLDRWLWGQVGAMVCTISQSSDVPNDTFQSSYKVDVTTVDTSIAAGDLAHIIQRIEGYNVRDLIGTTFTLSFWVKSPKTGIHCVSFRNSGSGSPVAADRSYIKEYTIVAANTWEYKTITVAGGLITAGTWNWTNGFGLDVAFTLASGTTFQTTADAWQTGNFIATANQVNVMDSAANNFYLTGVQLEPGSVATPFERRSYGQELSLCQRYYQLAGNGCFGFVSNATTIEYAEKFEVAMRSAPTCSYFVGATSRWRIYGKADVNNGSSASLANISATAAGFWTQQGGFTGLSAGVVVTSRNNSADSLFIQASAEL